MITDLEQKFNTKIIYEREIDSFTPTQNTAIELHNLGLNVLPRQIGLKGSYMPHKRLQNTRLYYNPSDPRVGDLIDCFSGKCNIAVMAGRTSRNLFIFDCESKAALEYMMLQLQARDVALWVVKSPSKKAGGHIYLLSRDGELKNVEPSVLKDLEIRANGRYVLTVNSIHPDPSNQYDPVYSWLSREGDDIPAVTLNELAGLTDYAGNEIKLELVSKPKSSKPAAINYPYSKQTQDYLQHGHSITQGSRHNRLFSAASDFARCNVAGYANYTLDDAMSQLAPIAASSGLPDAEIARVITNAYEFVTQPTFKVIPRWQAAYNFAQNHKFEGRTANTDRAVMLALCERARLDNRDVFRASERELSELAHLSRNPVSSSLDRLKTAGYIKQIKSKEGSAALWRFTNKVIVNDQQSDESDPLLLSGRDNATGSLLSFLFNSDIFEQGGFSLITLKIYYLVLLTVSVTIKEIAQKLNITVARTRYQLKKLVKFELVQKDDRTHYSAYPATFEEIEKRVFSLSSVQGKSARRKRKHDKERALYAGLKIVQWREQYDKDNFKYRAAIRLKVIDTVTGEIYTHHDNLRVGG